MEPEKKPLEGPCDHAQPADVALMGENYLKSLGISQSAWDGCRFGYGGNGGTGPFKSVYTEVERRNGNWVAVKLNRSKENLTADQTGFQIIALSPEAQSPQ